MGLNQASVQFLFDAMHQEVSFQKTLMIGRQSLSISPIALRRLCRKYQIQEQQAYAAFKHMPAHAELFFEMLSADEASSMDNSDYEGATFYSRYESAG